MSFREIPAYIRECCRYNQDDRGIPVPGSVACTREFCVVADTGVARCTKLSVISPKPPAGAEELSRGSGVNELPPSIAPGDSGTENNNETEKNTSQNTGDDTTTFMKNETKDIKDRNDLSLGPLNPPNEESNKFETEINATD
jgi:hypothetical protein